MPSSSDFKTRIAAAWHIWQTSPQRYSKLSAVVPPLIVDVERAVRAAVAGNVSRERRDIYGCAADLYFLLRNFTKRIGRVALSLLAADRAFRAAEVADDPLRLAAAEWNMAHVLLADGQPEGAEAVAMDAVSWLRPPLANDANSMALCGSLLLVGSVAAVRYGDAWTARARIDEAAKLAARTGERNVLWTAFGPVNVAMHAVDIEQEAGEAAEGLHLAEQVDHHKAASIERRVAFRLEQACCYRQRRDTASVLLLLLQTEREAPEDVAHRPLARDLLRSVVRQGRRSVASEAAQLAGRVGVDIA
ncbi:MAG: helix-turn-helix domain-containing protein [Pseudonocardiaceae bacterium]